MPCRYYQLQGQDYWLKLVYIDCLNIRGLLRNRLRNPQKHLVLPMKCFNQVLYLCTGYRTGWGACIVLFSSCNPRVAYALQKILNRNWVLWGAQSEFSNCNHTQSEVYACAWVLLAFWGTTPGAFSMMWSLHFSPLQYFFGGGGCCVSELIIFSCFQSG